MVEDPSVGSAQEQHGGRPLGGEVGEQGLARTGGRLVDREPVGQGAVELTRERRGRAVGDGELHGDDRGAVLLHESLRHPAERVGRVDPRRLTGVEQHEPQRVVVAQVGTEHGRAHLDAAPVAVGEEDDAVLDALVVVAVADEVQHVHVVVPQPCGEGLHGRRRQAVELHDPLRDARGHRVLHPAPLGLDVELGQVGGRGDDDEDAQRPVDHEGPRGLGHLEVAHHRRALGLRDVAVGAPVVEQLPRQPGDRRGVGEPQPQAQPVAGAAGGVLRARPREHDVLGEDRLEERSAEVHRGLARRVGAGPAGAAAPRVELEQEVLQLRRVEGKPERRRRALAERAGGHPHTEEPGLLRLEEEVEVLIRPGGHGGPFAVSRWYTTRSHGMAK